MKAHLCLADGKVFSGESIGLAGKCVGEVVFNTSMSGYQEVVSDPCCAEQIVVMTYPLIGNCGVNFKDACPDGIGAKGLIVQELCDLPSNYTSEETLHSYMVRNRIVGIKNVDTRALTKHLRKNGSMMGIIGVDSDPEELSKYLAHCAMADGRQTILNVSTQQAYTAGEGDLELTVVDFGTAKCLVKSLVALDCKVKVVPPTSCTEEVLSGSTSGVIISDGPGDPQKCSFAVDMISEVAKSGVPALGISLGNQLLGLALGCSSSKLKFGHRGSHPVRDLATSRLFITTQNHGFVLDSSSMDLKDDLVITYVNLHDDTVEGFKHKLIPVEGVQFVPEMRPDLMDSENAIVRFVNRAREYAEKTGVR